MKKLVSILLTFALVFSFASVAAFAEQTTPVGSITVNNATIKDGAPAATYSIYKMLDLAGYNPEKNAYSYTIAEEWEEFFTTGEGAGFITLEDNTYVKWAFGDDESRAPEFAKKAGAYVKAKNSDSDTTNDIPVVKTTANTSDYTVTGTSFKFSDLPLGYYLIDSTMGALCGLTTTNYNAQVNAKNGIPTINKYVQEDSIEGSWQGTNTADIGQTVYYKVTINVHPGAENYVLHDKMDEGIIFENVTNVTLNGTTVDASKYDVYTHPGHTAETTDDVTDDCTFEVRFEKEFCDSFKANDKVEIFYTAFLNENAVIAGEGNVNKAYLGYGEGHETEVKTTTTYTYSFDIAKTDDKDKLLGGAEFKLYINPADPDPAVDDDDPTIPLVDMGKDAEGVQVYRRATPAEIAENTVIVVDIIVADGLVRIEGFDNGTYYLEETVAPSGYNMLTARKEFTIADGNLDATISADGTVSTGSGVHVVNKTGNRLPETGGTGTMMFVLIGTIVVLGAGVLLVTKKRMSMIED